MPPSSASRPTAMIEAGCQGTMRIRITLAGAAGPHRSAVDGPQRHAPGRAAAQRHRRGARAPARRSRAASYHEALQAVRVDGGVAANVVPDRVEIVVNHRFAPDRTPAEAEAHVRAVVEPWLDDGDTFEVVDVAPGARPGARPPAARRPPGPQRPGGATPSSAGPTWPASPSSGCPPSTSARVTPTIAHTAGEFVTRGDLDAAFAALDDLPARGRRWRPASLDSRSSYRRSRRGSRAAEEQ